MDYMEEWNFLVDEHQRNRSESEDKIQSLWESYLSHPSGFGYKSGDVLSKSSLQFGSTEREVPDIILQKDGEPLCVIELKRYTLPRAQDFVKQTLTTLFGNNLLSAEEIKRLQKEDYCKQTLGIQFPLLEPDPNKQKVSGHRRYWAWQNFHIGGFYVCNDWWKPKFPIYESKIAEWLVGLERDFQRRHAQT